MAKALTKPQLLVKIEQLEQELGLAHKSLGDMERELAEFYVRDRPSRRAHVGQFADTVAVPIQSAENRRVVYLRGVPHLKTQAWEGGRKVTTYKPLAQ
jgi:hypothetical protein